MELKIIKLVNYLNKSSKNLTVTVIVVKNNEIDNSDNNQLINYLKFGQYFI